MNGEATNHEPDVTPEVIADIPKCLREFLEMLVAMQPYLKGIKPLRIPSKTLASRFIYLRWGIDIGQLNQNKQLFTAIETECYSLFQELLKQERIDWTRKDESYAFKIIKKNEDPDNLILEFEPIKEKIQ